MEYDQLYDESPYTSKEVRSRGGIMNTIRATFLICATILTSVFAVIYYGYDQDQFVVTSNGNFVSIFDRKSRTLNICDKGNCNLINPTFIAPMPIGAQQQGLLGQVGQRLIGSFPQSQTPGNPQMMQHSPGMPQQMGGHPQMMHQRGMMPHQMGGNPQMMNPQMNPQMMQQMQQRGMMPHQMGGNPQMMNSQMNPQMNPQMMQQMQQRGMMPQQMPGNPQMVSTQMVNGIPGAQAQMTVGAAVAKPEATEEAEEESTEEDKKEEETTEEETSSEDEEAAPV